jgi:hypothetical protein
VDAWRLWQAVKADGGSLRPRLLGIAVNVTGNQAARPAGTRRRPCNSRPAQGTLAILAQPFPARMRRLGLVAAGLVASWGSGGL